MKIETLLFCNNLKKLNCDANSILESIKDSDLVEITDDKLSVRRKEELKELPVIKKVKTEA